ncbi:MAG: NAD(+)/NADH kinase [Peptostreptococcaceae bacterium]|nr:NAD(+)/NADH kinase [Peptostreptococcaceae bacterium]
MKRKISVISGKNERSASVAQYVKDRLESHGFEVLTKHSLNAELMIAIGGDGSFLKAIHSNHFPLIPIVGINTGHLGFFQEILPNQINSFVEDYANGRYFIQQIHPVEALVCTKTSCIELLAINEFAVKSSRSRTVHLQLSVNGNPIEKFSGDGVIISTPTGSTAYNYSSGGSIIDPSLKTLQITPLSPINTNAYRSFTSSIVLPQDAVIRIVPEYRFENSVLIITDGTEHKYTQVTDISFRTSTMQLNLLRLNNYEFWKKVKEKFL